MNKRLLGLIGLITINLVLAIATLTMGQGDAPLPFPAVDGESAPVREGFTRIGDMVVPTSLLQTRGGYDASSFRRWNDGVIPYAFAGDVSQTNRNYAIQAMNEWQAVSGLRFIPRTNQTDYIYLMNDSGNWSYVGRIGGRQEIGIFNWSARFVVAHELAHAAGFIHEQSRPDRDQYVEIRWDRIPDNLENNFTIWEGSATSGAYDFESIMHYFPTAFSTNGQPTIVAKAPYQAFNTNGLMGQQRYLSAGDIAAMSARYPVGDSHLAALPLAIGTNSANTNNRTRSTATEPGATCAPNIGRTVWYTFRPSANRTYTLTTSGFDTALAVYRSVNNGWQQEGCMNAHANGTAEVLNFEAGRNITYYIMVGGATGAGGNLTLNAQITANLISNGGFERGSAGWTISSTGGNDTVICTNPAAAAQGSRCAMEFIGGAGESSNALTFASFPSGWSFGVGQTYTLSYSLRTRVTTANVRPRIIITYTDGSRQRVDLPTHSGASIMPHQRFSGAFSLQKANVSSIEVRFVSTSTSGALWVDDVRLNLVNGLSAPIAAPEAPIAAPLPLPAP
jgi:hypothetical protein